MSYLCITKSKEMYKEQRFYLHAMNRAERNCYDKIAKDAPFADVDKLLMFKAQLGVPRIKEMFNEMLPFIETAVFVGDMTKVELNRYVRNNGEANYKVQQHGVWCNGRKVNRYLVHLIIAPSFSIC